LFGNREAKSVVLGTRDSTSSVQLICIKLGCFQTRKGPGSRVTEQITRQCSGKNQKSVNQQHVFCSKEKEGEFVGRLLAEAACILQPEGACIVYCVRLRGALCVGQFQLLCFLLLASWAFPVPSLSPLRGALVLACSTRKGGVGWYNADTFVVINSNQLRTDRHRPTFLWPFVACGWWW
jgi:hypothetical protein